jgi:hypothetical protein
MRMDIEYSPGAPGRPFGTVAREHWGLARGEMTVGNGLM